MATRGERFRAEQERAHPDRKTTAGSRARNKLDEAKGAVSGTVRPVVSTGLRNLSAGKKATYALEDSAQVTPSRKSTRRSSGNHEKAATPLTSRQKLRTTSPASRHAKRA